MATVDLSEKLKQQYASQVESELSGLKTAYDKSMQGYDEQAAKLPAQYEAARNDAAAQNAMARKNFNEQAMATGMNSGTTGQAALAQSAAFQKNIAGINRQQQSAMEDIQRGRQNLQTQYESAVAQARAANDARLNDALYQEMLRVQGIEREDKLLADQRAREDKLLADQIAREDALRTEAWGREDAQRAEDKAWQESQQQAQWGREDQLLAEQIARENALRQEQQQREDALRAEQWSREDELLAAEIARQNALRQEQYAREDQLLADERAWQTSQQQAQWTREDQLLVEQLAREQALRQEQYAREDAQLADERAWYEAQQQAQWGREDAQQQAQWGREDALLAAQLEREAALRAEQYAREDAQLADERAWYEAQQKAGYTREDQLRAEDIAREDYLLGLEEQRLAQQLALQYGYYGSGGLGAIGGMSDIPLPGSSSGGGTSGGSTGVSSGGGGGSNLNAYGYDEHGYTTDEIKAMQRAAGIEADGIWGPDTQRAYEAGYGNGSGFSYSANQKHAEAAGGSYYSTVAGSLKDMKGSGASNSEAAAYLKQLLAESYITPNEYSTLYNKYRNDSL